MDSASYPQPLRELCADLPLNELGPGKPNRSAEARLRGLTPASALRPHTVVSEEAARACLAGLWLVHDYLDESHRISQDLPGAEGSYWHAIMHRREPDASNSKYWFRRLGNHPVLVRLAAEAPALGYQYSDPLAFVDFCERVRNTGSSEEDLARRVQQLEWALLFAHCYEAAIGEKGP